MKTGDGSTGPVTLEALAAATPAPDAWGERMNAFAIATGKTREWLEGALKPLVGEPGGGGALEALSDSAAVHDADLEKVLVNVDDGIPLGIFRKNLPKLRGPQGISNAGSSADGTVSYAVLPTVPEDASFLEMLRVGGVLKPSKTEVISAIKAALASRLNLFDLPDVITQKMESWSEEQEEPVGENFFELRKLVTTRKYSEVLSVLKVEGSFMTESRKKAFLHKLDVYFWPEVRSFYDVLKQWQEALVSGMSNPGMLLGILAMGQQAGGMPAGALMQPPDGAPVRDSAEGVINQINKVFAGVGIPVARALAYDATRIKTVLEESTLPASIGAASREQMLKMLGVGVAADYVRLEQNLTRFVLALMDLPRVASGQEEQVYLLSMSQLGASIPWDKLPDGSGRSAGLKGRREQL